MSETTFEVPEGTGEEAKASAVDELRADAKAAIKAVEYPEGAPKFRPLLDLEFDERGPAIAEYQAMQRFLKAHPGVTKAKEVDADSDAEVEIGDETIEVYQLLAIMNRFMKLVAVDQDEYATWKGRKDAAVFTQTFNAYQAESQPGEASSSAS